MKLTSRESFALSVCRFASETGIPVRAVIELVRLANRAFKAGEYQANTGDGRRFERASAAFEKEAEWHGLVVQWPGLWPSLTYAGRNVELPS